MPLPSGAPTPPAPRAPPRTTPALPPEPTTAITSATSTSDEACDRRSLAKSLRQDRVHDRDTAVHDLDRAPPRADCNRDYSSVVTNVIAWSSTGTRVLTNAPTGG